MEVDGAKLSEELFSAYLKQMLVDGFFHADPHPGNVFLTDDNRIALLDLGMVSNIGSTFQENLLRLLLAISNGRGDEAAEISIKMGEPKIRFDEADFRHRVSDLGPNMPTPRWIASTRARSCCASRGSPPTPGFACRRSSQ